MAQIIDDSWDAYHNGFEYFDMKRSIEAMLELARFANAYVEQNKPWALAKTDEKRLSIVLGNLVKMCRDIGEMLQPIIPDSAAKILEQVGEAQLVLGDPLFPMMEE